MAILLVYKEPKPFWVEPGVYTSDCTSIFTGPAYNQFMATLVIFYSISIFKRYQIIGKRWQGVVLIAICVYLNLMTLAFSILDAQHFIYQNIMGIIIAVVILVGTNAYDNKISILCLRLGFFIKSSRKYKFFLLVALLLIFSVVLSLTSVGEGKTYINARWIENYNVLICLKLFR